MTTTPKSPTLAEDLREAARQLDFKAAPLSPEYFDQRRALALLAARLRAFAAERLPEVERDAERVSWWEKWGAKARRYTPLGKWSLRLMADDRAHQQMMTGQATFREAIDVAMHASRRPTASEPAEEGGAT